MEQKFPVRNFLKLWYTSQGFPDFRKFRIMLLHSSLEISGNLNLNCSSNVKRRMTPLVAEVKLVY